MKVSKDLFVEIINDIRKQEEIHDNISKALDPCCEGNGFFYSGDRYYHRALMKLLKTVMNDKDDFIEWWLWESSEDRTVTLKEGKELHLTEIEDLYDFLIEYYPDKGEA